MKNITYVISNIDRAVLFESIVEQLNKQSFSLSFILLNPGDSYFETWLKGKNIPVHRIRYRNRKDIPKGLFRLTMLLRKLKPDVIHTHFLEASFLGMIAGKLAGIKTRISSRHHTTLHHVYFKNGLYYDKIINKLATHLIAVSSITKDVLVNMEHVAAGKVTVIDHGIDLSVYKVKNELNISRLSEKYHTKNHYPVIGVIARQVEWKGIQHIIPSFKKLLEQYPDAKLVLANAVGDYQPSIDTLLKQIPAENQVCIPFESDIASLYNLFDMYVHVPIDPYMEAFGLTYIEALASGIPSVFTLSGIAHSFIKDKENALVVPFENSDAIYHALMELMANEELRKKITGKGLDDVSRLFPLSKMIQSFENLYLSV